MSSAPDQPSLLPNDNLTLDCLGSDLAFPGDAIFINGNTCLTPSGLLRRVSWDLLGQNLGCQVPAKTAQRTAPVTARKEDLAAVTGLRSCV